MRTLGSVLTLWKRSLRCNDLNLQRILESSPYQLHPSALSSSSLRHSSVTETPWIAGMSSQRNIHISSSQASPIPFQETEYFRQLSGGEKVKNFLPPTQEGKNKPRVVVLGAGWAACRLMKDLNTKYYDIVCISPRNHMVFTPLLASTCVGTLEFRSVAESVRTIQPAIAREKNSYFFLARCTQVDTEHRLVYCKSIGLEETTAELKASGEFLVSYDKLIIASGAEPLTFGIDGVSKHSIFLREVRHAKAIRAKLLLNLAIAATPGVSEEEKRKVLSIVIVGGGPTGVEFCGELSDFIKRDVARKFSHMKDKVQVTLIEANKILSSFDIRLRKYAMEHLKTSGVNLVKGIVKDVTADKVVLSDGKEIPFGLLVWSTGVGPSDFVKSLPFQKALGGRIGVDEYLRVPGHEGVYSIGDCAGYLESTGKPVLPALAQVAERQGLYLAKCLNDLAKVDKGRAGAVDLVKPFVYRHLGSMASMGNYKALVDLRESKDDKGVSLAGFLSWVIWRSAYLTRVVSWRNRIYVAINWATTFVSGRDITRI